MSRAPGGACRFMVICMSWNRTIREAGLPAEQSQSAAIDHDHPVMLATRLDGMLARSGTAGHAFVARFFDEARHPDGRETLSDTFHQLSLLHGARPSLFEVAGQSDNGAAAGWLAHASRVFSEERHLLAHLISAAGPPPIRKDQTRIEEAVRANRAALVTLASSDRFGCAIGAAAALMMDWGTISTMMRSAAQRFGIAVTNASPDWPDRNETFRQLVTATVSGGERAVTFGFQTLLAQHRAFWDILHSRA